MDNTIQKSINVAREDFISELTDLINNSNLPPIILEPIFKDMYTDIKNLLQKQTDADRQRYNEAMSQQNGDDTNEISERERIQRQNEMYSTRKRNQRKAQSTKGGTK